MDSGATTPDPTQPRDARARLLPPGFPWRALILLALLALALRVGTSLTRIDEFNQEGLAHGTRTRAMLEGVPLLPSEAPRMIHFRSSILMSWISVPFFLVFGPSTFAVRISGILFHLATLATLMLLVHRQFGRLASIFAGALIVLVPPSLARIDVLSYGDHIESLPFMFGTALLAFTFIEDRTGRRWGLAAALGVAAALCFTWHPQARFGLATLGLTCLVLAPRKLLSPDSWLALAPGVALGLVPFFLGNWLTARNGLAVLESTSSDLMGGGTASGRALKWLHLWTRDLPGALQYDRPLWNVLTILLAAGCALGLLVAAARAIRRRELTWHALLVRAGWFVAYPLGFSLVYTFINLEILLTDVETAIAVRYILPIVPFVLLPIAIAAARLVEHRRKALGALVIGPALLLGTYGSLSTWDVRTILHEPPRIAGLWEFSSAHLEYASLTPEERGQLRQLERDTYGDPAQDATTLRWRTEHVQPDKLLEVLARVDGRPEWTWPLRYWLPPYTFAAGATGTPDDLVKKYRRVPAPYRPYAGSGLAQSLAREARFRPTFAGAALAAGETSFESQCLARGFGVGLTQMPPYLPRWFNGKAAAARVEPLPKEVDRREIAFGFGFRVGTVMHQFFLPSYRYIDEFLANFPKSLHAPFARGLGAGYRLRFLDPPSADLESPVLSIQLSHLPPQLEAEFRAGLGGSDAAD